MPKINFSDIPSYYTLIRLLMLSLEEKTWDFCLQIQIHISDFQPFLTETIVSLKVQI